MILAMRPFPHLLFERNFLLIVLVKRCHLCPVLKLSEASDRFLYSEHDVPTRIASHGALKAKRYFRDLVLRTNIFPLILGLREIF